MTCSFWSPSNHVNVLGNMRKGGLQIFSWFVTNVFYFKVNERTHPYGVNHFNGVMGELVYKGGK
jgi:hypothetical protein